MIPWRHVALALVVPLATLGACGTGGGEPTSGGAGCYTMPVGTACDWIAGSGVGCTGQTPGSCPSAGLLGCCVDTKGAVEGASCLYQAALASAAKANCTGPGMTWQTTAP